MTHVVADRSELQRLVEAMDERKRRAGRRLVWTLFPDDGPLRRELYFKHSLFFAAGAKHRERAFIAGNRVGKTVGAGVEWAFHLTGKYPDWWKGHRFTGPIRLLVSGDTHETTRDILQLKMLGATSDRKEDIGTGLIPGDAIMSWVPRPHVKGAIEKVVVKHASGQASEMWLRSYEQGREIFQGFELDGFWADEECPEAIYDEAQIRLMTRRGHSTLTFTPLNGLTPLVVRLLKTDDAGSANRTVVQCGWDDVPHLDEAMKVEMLNKLPPHQRDARTKGIPALGAGAIYPVHESEIVVEPFELPRHWPRGYGFDVGWRRTAAIFGALDRDSDVLYVYSEHYQGEAQPSVHAEAIKRRGRWLTGAIDPASRGRQQSDGDNLLRMYRDLDLNIVEADNAVEAGLYEVWQRLSTGRLKVFRTCVATLAEYRLYRRDENGKIVKDDDHAMDALRYLVMSLQAVVLAPPASEAPSWRDRLRVKLAEGSAMAA
jgi:phage terminase large subunit-like protein